MHYFLLNNCEYVYRYGQKSVSRTIDIEIYKTILPAILYGSETWKINQKEKEALAIWDCRLGKLKTQNRKE